jgi:hypothetical protein
MYCTYVNPRFYIYFSKKQQIKIFVKMEISFAYLFSLKISVLLKVSKGVSLI